MFLWVLNALNNNYRGLIYLNVLGRTPLFPERGFQTPRMLLLNGHLTNKLWRAPKYVDSPLLEVQIKWSFPSRARLSDDNEYQIPNDSLLFILQRRPMSLNFKQYQQRVNKLVMYFRVIYHYVFVLLVGNVVFNCLQVFCDNSMMSWWILKYCTSQFYIL